MKYYIQVEQGKETIEYEFVVDCLYIKCAVCGCKCHPVELLHGEPHNEWEKCITLAAGIVWKRMRRKPEKEIRRHLLPGSQPNIHSLVQ